MSQPNLEHGNELFHDAYDAATDDATRDAPVLVLFADKLFARQGSTTKVATVTTPAFEALKNAAHVPVAAFALAHGRIDSALDEATLQRFRALLEAATHARGELDTLEGSAKTDALRLFDGCEAFLRHVVAVVRVDAALLETFAAAAGEVLRRLSETATDLLLTALDAATEAAIASFDARERATFQVVVAGHHQARERNLGTQYFRLRLGESEANERRVLYAEGASSFEEALEVVAKKRVDRELAKAFFGDETRMQRDLLGDAAASLLQKRKLEQIR